MSDDRTNPLFELLPRIIRRHDIERGRGSTLALTDVLDTVRQELADDIDRLRRDAFIETCDDDAIARLGALLAAPPGATRAEVANLLTTRRRPGRVSTVSQVVRDVTGCTATVREVLPVSTEPVRVEIDIDPVFAHTLHLAAVREIRPGCFTVHPLGVDTPLLADPTHSRPGASARRLDRRESIAELCKHLGIVADGRLLGGSEIALGDLTEWARVAGSARVLVDPVLGRLAFAEDDRPGDLRVSHTIATPLDVGGGPYVRYPDARHVHGGHRTLGVGSVGEPSLSDALAGLTASAAPTAVQVSGHGIHEAKFGAEPWVIDLLAGCLSIVATDASRPSILGNIDLSGPTDGSVATVVLDGLLIDGEIRLHGSIDLTIRHCTVRPMAAHDGAAAIVATTTSSGSVHIDHSVVGSVFIESPEVSLVLSHSIIDASSSWAVGTADEAIPHITIEACTLLGEVPAWSIVTSSIERAEVHDAHFGQPAFATPIGPIGAQGAHAAHPAVHHLDRLHDRLADVLPVGVEPVIRFATPRT